MIEAKKSLSGVAPYAPGRPISEIKRKFGLEHVVKLASNENPLGASPKAKEAAKQSIEDVFLYPDPDFYALRRALAAHHNLEPEQFVFGTGSDGLIELVCKTFLGEGDESIMPTPSFSLYALNVRSTGATPIEVPLDENWNYSPMAFLPYITERTKVIWLCNPNNPTGGIYSAEEQRAFLEAVPEDILVVIDEAYYEYACHVEEFPNTLEELSSRKNVLILRTFSKIYGLAGLRVGYGMADSALILEMEKTRPPFNVCMPAQLAAEAALSDIEFLERSVCLNRENMKFLEQSIEDMGLSFVPSFTNFIAVDVKTDAKEVYEKLLALGYIVKGGHVLGMPHHLRVTVGTRAECEGFVLALKKALAD